MDYTEIIVALIAAGGSFGATYITSQKQLAVLQEKIDTLKDDVSRLSEKVERHNNFGSRIAVMESKLDELKEREQK